MQRRAGHPILGNGLRFSGYDRRKTGNVVTFFRQSAPAPFVDCPQDLLRPTRDFLILSRDLQILSFPRLGQACPKHGQTIPSLGKGCSTFGNAFPKLGKPFPSFGETIPSPGQAFPSLGRASPPPMPAFPDSIPVSPVSFLPSRRCSTLSQKNKPRGNRKSAGRPDAPGTCRPGASLNTSGSSTASVLLDKIVAMF